MSLKNRQCKLADRLPLRQTPALFQLSSEEAENVFVKHNQDCGYRAVEGLPESAGMMKQAKEG